MFTDGSVGKVKFRHYLRAAGELFRIDPVPELVLEVVRLGAGGRLDVEVPRDGPVAELLEPTVAAPRIVVEL